jgi:RND family efflux transporter MFP subunit
MRLKIILPVLVLALAFLGALTLMATRETVTPKPPERRLPTMRVTVAKPQSVHLQVRSQGTVMPRTESQLIPEVSGPVIWTSPALVSGGYFDKGDSLVRIDPAQYETALERARANVGRTTGEFEYAEAELRRQEALADEQIVSANSFEEAQRSMSVAGANLREANASLEEAERNLDRTRIRAPFHGRVREETVDVGQFLNRGTVFATLYATDFLEVRLPVADDQLAFFEKPLWQRDTSGLELPAVRLFTKFAGAERSWPGRIVRTEGEIDAKSRMVHVIARVENPEAGDGSDSTPLPVGLFVQAEIDAKTEHGLFVLPRSAMWDESQVVIVDGEDRLRLRHVEVLRIDRDEVLLSSGLEAGERVCVSPPADLIDGQVVQPYERDASEVDS